MDKSNIVEFSSRDEISDALTDLLRTGAQQLIATAVEAELEGYMAQFAALMSLLELIMVPAPALQKGCQVTNHYFLTPELRPYNNLYSLDGAQLRAFYCKSLVLITLS